MLLRLLQTKSREYSFGEKSTTMNTNSNHHIIPLAEAAQMTQNYRLIFGNLFLGASFDKQAIIEILSQTGAAKLKIYNARKNDLSPNYVLCAVDELGNDILAEVLDRAAVCPPECGTVNVLNSSI